MPELPEVEVLVRHLRPLVAGRRIGDVAVLRTKSVRPDSPERFRERVAGARAIALERRAKYLRFELRRPGERCSFPLLGHLGMTGRMFLQPQRAPLPRHAAVTLDLGRDRLVFQDTRYFGRLTLDASPLARLAPEPLGDEFTPEQLGAALSRSGQPIKTVLLDQSVVAGLGNIYASEALWRARISPRLPARRLGAVRRRRLWAAIREVLAEAIALGSTVPLNWSGEGRAAGDRLFYYGRAPDAEDFYEERLRVYDREGHPCVRCGRTVRRLVQGGRSTFFCPRCQRG